MRAQFADQKATRLDCPLKARIERALLAALLGRQSSRHQVAREMLGRALEAWLTRPSPPYGSYHLAITLWLPLRVPKSLSKLRTITGSIDDTKPVFDARLLNELRQSLEQQTAPIAFTLHVNPSASTSAGLQTTDWLRFLGFKENKQCQFSNARRCFSKEVPEGYDLQRFASAFNEGFGQLQLVPLFFGGRRVFDTPPDRLERTSQSPTRFS